MAEVWNGSSWKIESTPNPTGAKSSQLTGVSCSSASACTAVGYYYLSAGADSTLAEAWNGSTWKIESTPVPTGAGSSSLTGVSCTSVSACTAVGSYDLSATGTVVTLAESWNGSSWQVQSTPKPAGAKSQSLLTGVSCTSASACTAAGALNNGYIYLTLADRYS